MPRPFIMVAPNGVKRTKSDHPQLPVSIPETVAVTKACVDEGADALHLHVRDENGGHSLDVGLYREALSELDRVLPGLPVQITTEAGGIYDVEAQLGVIEDLRPAWASLSLREAARDAGLARRLYDMATDQGTELQHIIFDEADAALLADWQANGVIGQDASVLLVLGRYTRDMNSDPAALEPLLAALPPVGKWMLCAFGANEHACLQRAAGLGGDVRIGFENSFVQASGEPWPDMMASVRAFCAAL